MKLHENNLFTFKTAAGLIAVCVLISVFIPLVQVKAVYPPLDIVKTVDKIFPSPGEEIVYTLTYKNNTSNEITGVVIKDPFTNTNQQYLIFVSANPSPTSGNDTWEIGSLGPNESGQIIIRAKIDKSISGWASEIKNRATIESDQTYIRRSNTASVFIVIDSPRNKSINYPSVSGELIIEKTARNLTRGSSYGYYYSGWLNTVYAEPGDEIEFLIKIKAPRDKEIDSVRLSDDLPPKLSYISDSTTIDGSYEPDNITSSYIYIGDVYPHIYREIKFRVRIYSASKFNFYPIDLVNVAYAWGSDGNKVKDTVKIIVREPSDENNSGTNGSSGGIYYYPESIFSGPKLISGPAYLVGSDTKTEQETEETVEEIEEQAEEGEIKGASDVKVGANLIGLLFLVIISSFIGFVIYCRVREDKLPKPLLKPYFKLKLFFATAKLRLKKNYW